MNVTKTPSEIVEKVIHEHDLLREKVRQIHSVLSSREPSSSEIETLLGEFRTVLLVHFMDEEQEGFFEEVTAREPRLTDRAGNLCIEHKQLLREADELCRFAASGSPSMPWWRELYCRCHEFITRLLKHEHEENSLLQEAYHSDIGTYDQRYEF